ncbi:aminopeptidase A isoform X2 [Anoplolepis gracilipes]|uniref:aminopeptidase A isoform X2 n=1 Tax=Anoplolepis gracilipes TaxID=354296 RepID=UPI003BA11322
MDDHNKVENRSKGGAHRPDAASPTTTTTISFRYKNAAPALLCFACGACFVLSLICTCLATLVVLLDQAVEATNYRYDSNKHTTMADPDKIFRLPKEVKPIHYDLLLYPNLKENTFSGKVTILIDVLDDRRTIALHQKDLNITSVELITYGLEEDYKIDISSISKPTKYEIFVISAENEFKSGLYNLSLKFNGSLKNKIVGFYSSQYEYDEEDDMKKIQRLLGKESAKKFRYIATTKFEPTYARHAFPCFDEPNFKAEFSIKLVCPMQNSYHSLSNMDIVDEEYNNPEENLKTTTFAKTVPMSTYIVCFIVSDMIKSKMMAKGLNGREFPVSVYSTKLQVKEKRNFPLEIGVKAIEYYIKLFEIDYPLPKLDMVAIPDFVSGAMENWGLVTYREKRFLYDDYNNSIIDKRETVNVICHELAHMWFGNLVTLSWWNDLWLNEGFATFMSFKSANEILPNQKYIEQFSVDVMHKVMITDAKLSSHPIIQTVENPDEITSIFDEISYKKGASIIRMMENFIGPDVFYNAISTYLNKYAYQNAETTDLFNILQDVIGSKLNITAIMDTWTRQEGYPVINVQKVGNTYILTQKRFLDDSDITFDLSKSDYKYRWTVPITYITNKNEIPTLIWFDKDADKVVIEVDQQTKWIKLNVNQVGYYRVNYEEEWKTLEELLQYHSTRLSIADRANLLDDLYSLAAANEIEYSVALTISLFMLPQEYQAVPWAVASSKITAIYSLLRNLPPGSERDRAFSTRSQFQAFAVKVVDDIYNDVTWTVDDIVEDAPLTNIDNKLHITVLEYACAMEHKKCLIEAGRIFKDWLLERKILHPDIRELVYYYGMRYISQEDQWKVMFEYFKNETDPIEKYKLMKGLAGIKSTNVLEEYIEKATDETIVRTQDFLTCLMLISENPDGTLLVWNWVRDNWEFLVQRYTLNDRYLGQLIPAITKSFATQIKLDEMKIFFERYPDAGAGENNRAKALETVSSNIKWLSRIAPEINKWFHWAFDEGHMFIE